MPRFHKSTPSRSKRTKYVDLVIPTAIPAYGKMYKEMKDFERAMKFRTELSKRQDPESKKLRELMEAKEAIRKGYTDRAAHNQKVKADAAKADAAKN